MVMRRVADDAWVGPAGLRTLRDVATSTEVTIVTTPQGLLDAVEAGARHIDIRSHLDMTTVARSFDAQSLFAPLVTKTIRGNCSDDPAPESLGIWVSDTPLLERTAGQCVIVIDGDLLPSEIDGNNLWLHNLYIRHQTTSRSGGIAMVWCGFSGCNLWMTSVTLQGGGVNDYQFATLEVKAGQVFAEGLTIADTANAHAAVWVSNGATVTFVGCTITRNALTNTNDNHLSGVINVNAVDPNNVNSQYQDTILRLERCDISDNDIAGGGPDLQAWKGEEPDDKFSDHDALIFSDVEHPLTYNEGIDEDNNGTTWPITSVPSDREGMTSSSRWFVNIQQEVAAAQAATPLPASPPLSAVTEPPDDSAAAGVPIPAPAPAPIPAPAPAPLPRSADTQVAPAPEEQETSKEEGVGAAAIAGGVVAAVLLLAATIAALLFMCRRWRRADGVRGFKGLEEAHKADPSLPPAPVAGEMPPPATPDEQTSPEPPETLLHIPPVIPAEDASKSGVHYKQSLAEEPLSFTTSTTTPHFSSNAASTTASFMQPAVTLTGSSHNAGQAHPTRLMYSLGGVHSARNQPPEWGRAAAEPPEVDTFDLPHTAPSLMSPPASGAPVDDRKDFLQQQLDGLGLKRPILGGLLLLGRGANTRLQGGQAVVQMARSTVNGLEYAIKFFVSRAAFNVEESLYRQDSSAKASDLARFLPEVRNIVPNTDGQAVDAQGHPLPPCIVMERGESLDIWAARAQPDRPQAFTMMHQLAIRIRDLHGLGYVHRDLKPGNVMWLPRENRWTLIDFGCAARTGKPARIGFSVAYAAPEVIAAYRRGDKTMVAQEALDVWSLGVMAFELLTGDDALPMHEGKDRVMDRIEGCTGLNMPWEADNLTAVNRRRLGVFRETVLSLLSRDPAERPSMESFCKSCNRVLAGSTTVQV